MGWITITRVDTGETVFIGDDNQYRKYQGKSHMRTERTVTEGELQQIDNMGENDYDKE